MLILTRKKRQRIKITHKGEELDLIVLNIKIKPDVVKFGFIGSEEFIIEKEEFIKGEVKCLEE
jgi:sRNA-binding carbon storage regulator CsrA